MDHSIVVIVPIPSSAARQDYWHNLVRYFVHRGVFVITIPNGPDSWEATEFLKGNLLDIKYHLVLNGGDLPNPYIARNSALDTIFRDPGIDCAVLIDSDCTPRDDYLERLLEILGDSPRDLLIAGRTTTEIPEGSLHFDMLRGRGFECYDGFTPPDHTVGSNMVIGRRVWQIVGPMRESVVSGGDGLYGIRFKELDGRVTVGDKLLVAKKITGMTLRGIIEKQFRRACCFPESMIPNPNHTLQEITKVLHDLSLFTDTTLEYLADDYPVIVDRLFKLMMHLGILTHTLDKPRQEP